VRVYFPALRYGVLDGLMLAFIAALLAGGGWVWLVLAISSLGTGILDELIGNQAKQPAQAAAWICDVALYATLPLLVVMTLLYLHYVTGNDPLGVFSGLLRIGVAFGEPWAAEWMAITGATLGTSYFYALAGMTVAHELLHRTDSPAAQVVSRALLAFNLSGHYTTYHLYGHHRNVGTFKDPATARRGEYVLAFVFRCMVGEFREALRIERARLRRKGLAFVSWHNRILLGELYPLAAMTIVAMMGGYRGLIGFMTAASIAPLIQRLVDYSQHYGLVRQPGSPVEARHSWECVRLLTNSVQYNLALHADHHLAAGRPYWELRPKSGAPRLPCGYITASFIALVPPFWHRLVDPLLADWDERLANNAERALLRERGEMHSLPASGR
jgi:hypothetical protein